MSYILDALKKSDQERQRGTAPGMHSFQTTPGPTRRSWGKWILLMPAVLLLGIGFLAWWWINPMSGGQKEDPITQVPDKPSAESSAGANTAHELKPVEQPPKPATSASMQPSSNAEDPKTKGSSPKHSIGVPRVPTPEALSESRIAKARGETAKKPALKPSSSAGTVEAATRSQRGPGQTIAPKESSQDSSTRILSEMEKAATGAIGNLVDMPNGIAPGSGISSNQDVSRTTLPGAPVPAPRATTRNHDTKVPPADVAQIPVKPSKGTASLQDVQETPPTTAGKTEKTIPELRELSPTVQREIPSMSFTMLVYSEVPGNRMIRINGKLMREGDEVASGLKLEEIIPGGAVFSYRGQRFRKGVF